MKHLNKAKHIIKKGGKKMEVIMPVIKKQQQEKEITSPWEELGHWCSNFAKEKKLTEEETMAILEKVREEDEGCCRY